MTSNKSLATVAVSGPLRRTFSYHLPDDIGNINPGQRVLVEFGRTRTVGFYLGSPEAIPTVRTKPIIRLLDNESYFPAHLFKLCMWIADYYFANPADCLAAALPPVLKTRRAARFVWGTVDTSMLPGEVRRLHKPGRGLSRKTLASLLEVSGASVHDLILSGVVVEEWLSSPERPRQIISGYQADNPTRWSEFFRRRKFQTEPFDGKRSRSELKTEGWSDTHLRDAVKTGILRPVYENQIDRILDFVRPREEIADLIPSSEQASVIEQVKQILSSGFRVYLLHGITGSGKTLIYCHLAREVVERGGTVLVLTPEIALTGATLAYFRGFFGSLVTVIHSAMTSRERLESWRGIRKGRYRIVIGPRSAVLAPLDEIGLIIVDEEHDGSYKQDDPSPRFHGRDCAIMRAKISNVPILLGSASPSLESYHHTRTGRYHLLKLKERPGGARLPKVRIIDMQQQKLHGDLPYMSFTLKKEIDARLDREEQVILFLNRRGYSPQLRCADCGHVPSCPHCDLKLTYHQAGRKLSCHYCGYISLATDTCARCSSSHFLYPGAGTQKVEEHVARLFDRTRALRFDSDSASGRKNAHQMLHEFALHKYNLLLGTQMVTKGLDLPRVSLVGVLSADQGMDLPDFRASEKTFCRLLQVAGRSGRGANPGEVVIQTYYPESELIQDAARQDYTSFFEREIKSRQRHQFPPFTRLVRVIFSSPDSDKLESANIQFSRRLTARSRDARLGLELLGPAPCPMDLLRGNHRRHLFIKTKQVVRLTRLLTVWETEAARFGLPPKVKVVIDIDPDDMM